MGKGGGRIRVDSGFILFIEETFCSFFRVLVVETGFFERARRCGKRVNLVE